MSLKFGCVPPVVPPHLDQEHWQMADYVTLAAPPQIVDYTQWTPWDEWGVLGNDRLGDCVPAAMAHLLMCDTSISWGGNEAGMLTQAEIERVYWAITGGRDVGVAIADLLLWMGINYGSSGGMNDVWGYSERILGSAAIDPRNVEHVKLGISEFGGVMVGFYVTPSMMRSFRKNGVWFPPSRRTKSHGSPHCVPLLGYSAYGPVGVSWGHRFQATWDWFTHPGTVFETHATIAKRWLDRGGISPGGIDGRQLLADLGAL